MSFLYTIGSLKDQLNVKATVVDTSELNTRVEIDDRQSTKTTVFDTNGAISMTLIDKIKNKAMVTDRSSS